MDNTSDSEEIYAFKTGYLPKIFSIFHHFMFLFW